MSDERGDATVLTRQHVANAKDLREALGRTLVDVPELATVFGVEGGCKVWVWGVSAEDRVIIDAYAGDGDKRDDLKWAEAYVAAALRDGDNVEAGPLFVVPGPDNGKLRRLGSVFLNRMLAESQKLDLGEGFAVRVMEEVQRFATAEETQSSERPTSSASDD